MTQAATDLGGMSLRPRSASLRFAWAAQLSTRVAWLGEKKRAGRALLWYPAGVGMGSGDVLGRDSTELEGAPPVLTFAAERS
jgi:hypothetical protein